MAKKSRPAATVDTDAPGSNGNSRFRSNVLLAAMLFAPAAFLVLRGNLSVNEALVRFGCALLFAMVGTAVVVGTMPATDGAPDGAGQAGRSAEEQAPVSEATTSIGNPVTPVAQPAG